MKKLICCILCTFILFGANVNAESPTASKEIFDWTPFSIKGMLDLFYQAKQQGRNYPTQEQMQEAFGMDIAFTRSHVRLAPTIVDQATQVNPSLNPARKLWMNVPVGDAKMSGGYPSASWNNDVFTGWNYTFLMGAWNHSFFQCPAVSMNAAHKHGTNMLSGMIFFDGQTAKNNFLAVISQKEGSEYKYAEPLINLLMYLGHDGINYNWEPSTGYNGADLIAFHKRLHEIAKEKGFTNFYTGFYTNISTLSTSFAASNFYSGGKPIFNALMLNYTRTQGDFATAAQNAGSVNVAKGVTPNGDTEGLYGSGWIVTLKKDWPALQGSPQDQINICLWGEHDQCRLYSYTKGNTPYTFQENYQERIDRFFSGGNKNPAKLPAMTSNTNPASFEDDDATGEKAMTTFHGLATYLAERSAVIGKLPFVTNFNVGNGPAYHYKGKKTFDAWYNMGDQDMQPTYRWLVYDANTKNVSTAINPKFNHYDSYMGGSMLVLEGQVKNPGTDIILYRSDLEVNDANAKASIAFKMPNKVSGTPTNLYLILKTDKSADSWLEYPIGNISQSTWNTITFPLTGLQAGDKIKNIGFRVQGEETSNYQILLGELKLMDERAVPVEKPVNFLVEIKEETTTSMSMKMSWEMNKLAGSTPTREAFGLVYNDEVNVSHFEVLYKNGENGKVRLIAKTDAWSHFLGTFRFYEDDERQGIYESPYVGIRAVSIDKKTYSDVNWIQIQRADPLDVPTKKIDTYCESKLGTGGDYEKAIAVRWLKSVTTTGADVNLNYAAYAKVADGSNYVDYTNKPMKARQGSTFDFKFVGFDSGSAAADGLRHTFAHLYADWNNDGEFDPVDNEVLYSLGVINGQMPEFESATGVTEPITVPAGAYIGNVRMRLVFQDSWVPRFFPCGLTHKGFTFDFTITVTGDNPVTPSRDIRDKGEADEPEKLNTSMNQVVVPGSVSRFYPNPAKSTIYFENTEKVMIYTINGSLVYSGNANGPVNVSTFEKGVYVVKMQSGNVIRNQKMIKE